MRTAVIQVRAVLLARVPAVASSSSLEKKDKIYGCRVLRVLINPVGMLCFEFVYQRRDCGYRCLI